MRYRSAFERAVVTSGAIISGSGETSVPSAKRLFEVDARLGGLLDAHQSVRSFLIHSQTAFGIQPWRFSIFNSTTKM
jgi:hypothetical protein